MRGSPLIRTLSVLVALVLTALGLAALTRPAQVPAASVAPVDDVDAATLDTPFYLTLSARATRVTLESAGGVVDLRPESTTLAGTVTLEAGHPAVFIDITWADPDPGPTRFAKLVLEPPGHATLTRVFDAEGPLSDVWELHLHD